jgi:hypothetical protein
MELNKMAKTSWGIIAILALLGILIYLFMKKPSGQVSSSPSYWYNLYLDGFGGSSGGSFGSPGGSTSASTPAGLTGVGSTFTWASKNIPGFSQYASGSGDLYIQPGSGVYTQKPARGGIYAT